MAPVTCGELLNWLWEYRKEYSNIANIRVPNKKYGGVLFINGDTHNAREGWDFLKSISVFRKKIFLNYRTQVQNNDVLLNPQAGGIATDINVQSLELILRKLNKGYELYYSEDSQLFPVIFYKIASQFNIVLGRAL